jgi:hypothetical protein
VNSSRANQGFYGKRQFNLDVIERMSGKVNRNTEGVLKLKVKGDLGEPMPFQ